MILRIRTSAAWPYLNEGTVRIFCTTLVVSNISGFVNPNANAPQGPDGWRIETPIDIGASETSTDHGTQCVQDGLPNYTDYTSFEWDEPDGTVRFFPITTTQGYQTAC